PAGSFSHAKSPIILGVVGKDPFGAELDKLQGKTVNGRTLEIKRFKGALEFRGEETPGRRQADLPAKQAKKLAEMKSCHILFITSSEKNFLPQTLKPFRGASVLTVGETDSFAREGGIITFVDSENSVQLEINLAAAEQARLKISSKLLSLPKVIKIEHEVEKKEHAFPAGRFAEAQADGHHHADQQRRFAAGLRRLCHLRESRVSPGYGR